MAADLHIHSLGEDSPESVAPLLFGSPIPQTVEEARREHDRWNEAFLTAADHDNVWICEVSWLKAALFDSAREYVPSVAERVRELIGDDFPILTRPLADALLSAVGGNNSTSYEVTQEGPVADFLDRNMGKRIYTVSW